MPYVDRLSRNIFDKKVYTLYEKALQDQLELQAGISAVEKFQFGISLGLAKYYSDGISDNIKRAGMAFLKESFTKVFFLQKLCLNQI